MTHPQDATPHAPAPAGKAAAPGEAAAPDEVVITGGAGPPTVRDVEYKGAPLDAAKGPGLGCFWFQLAALGLLVVVTPMSVGWGWPAIVSGTLLIVTLVLLLFAGQTVIFLLRLVAADRRAELRRAPLASRTPTVGQIEDEAPAPTDRADPTAAARPTTPGSTTQRPHDIASSDQPGDAGSGVPE